MKRLLLALTVLSSPAVAMTEPTAGKTDPHVCDIAYNANDVVDVRARAGENIGIRFDPTETIMDVPLSDDANLSRAYGNGSTNALYLKAVTPNGMPPQPFIVRTKRADGTFRDYTFQWTALPANLESNPIITASNGPVTTEEGLPNLCYLIRFTYPADVKAAQAVAWRAHQAKREADAAEIALHTAQEQRAHNNHYVAQGDASIGPSAPVGQDAIWDDGNDTVMVFPGNKKIPVILTRLEDKKTDSEVSGFTVEQDGVIRIHSVLPFIRLRDGDRTLCLWNRAYNDIGRNPGTGTNNSHIERSVGSGH